MIITIAASALAIQLNIMPVRAAQPLVQPVQYGVPVRRPPCGHGWDVSARDGLCYPNGYLPPQDQAHQAPRIRRTDFKRVVLPRVHVDGEARAVRQRFQEVGDHDQGVLAGATLRHGVEHGHFREPKFAVFIDTSVQSHRFKSFL